MSSNPPHLCPIYYQSIAITQPSSLRILPPTSPLAPSPYTPLLHPHILLRLETGEEEIIFSAVYEIFVISCALFEIS